MQATILDATVTFARHPFVAPLILSSGAITEITEARAAVTVAVAGQRATGRGSIYLSDLWAWPDPTLTHAQRDQSLRQLCEVIARNLAEFCGSQPAHPLELGLRLHETVCAESTPPPLARAMCASPFDAAIHDAVGLALGRSAFALYEPTVALPTADPYFDGPACAAIRQVLGPPRDRLRAWCVVGGNDEADQLHPWVQERGYHCFKIKISGKDTGEDVRRTVAVYRLARGLGARSIELSVDSNEGNPNADSVWEYLCRLEEADPAAYAALRYLEQPTARDIRAHAFDWRAVAARKPVLLDEGLTSLALLREACRQGWSGLALKTCKGHSFVLTAAAWAHQHGLVLSVQDLTNPGLALIHAALLAAHLPTINGVELNSPQFTPTANSEWLPRLAGLFEPRDGAHAIPLPVPPGLGTRL